VHVGADQTATTPGLETVVGEVLDRRLLSCSSRPLAIALSGGGDSLALLLATVDWARRKGRSLIVLTVDHQLRRESEGWTKACAETAYRFNLPFRALAWSGEKPKTGLPAAARAARHMLLADAARQAGARVILMGHTADDVLEASIMRAQGSTTPSARQWSPSPAWPQGRGLFLLRPLLGVRRAEIRDWLRSRHETWIDDPANEDDTYARPRARRAISNGAAPSSVMATPSAAVLAETCRHDARGDLAITRAVLRNAEPEALLRFVSAACLCAAGTSRPPARDRVERLAMRATGEGTFVTSLAGARIEATHETVLFQREAGEAARGGLVRLKLMAGETGVWDGRFELGAHREIEVGALAGDTQPVVIGDGGQAQLMEKTPLAYARLLAACGAIDREPD
jgi:tRNA(Ile)-lysidine synthase